MGLHPPSPPPNFEAYPTPVVGGRFDIFPFAAHFLTLFGGCCNSPFGELGLKGHVPILI